MNCLEQLDQWVTRQLTDLIGWLWDLAIGNNRRLP